MESGGAGRGKARSEPWRSALPAGFAWPAGVRAAACFTFDVDAESAILVRSVLGPAGRWT